VLYYKTFRGYKDRSIAAQRSHGMEPNFVPWQPQYISGCLHLSRNLLIRIYRLEAGGVPELEALVPDNE
jgi:hypothetical protein